MSCRSKEIVRSVWKGKRNFIVCEDYTEDVPVIFFFFLSTDGLVRLREGHPKGCRVGTE